MNYFQNKGKDAHVAALGGFFFFGAPLYWSRAWEYERRFSVSLCRTIKISVIYLHKTKSAIYYFLILQGRCAKFALQKKRSMRWMPSHMHMMLICPWMRCLSHSYKNNTNTGVCKLWGLRFNL
jgi:hypothetical protein